MAGERLTTYKVRAPDGSILHIDGPQGASDDDLIRVAAAQYQPVNPTGSFGQNVAAGAGKAIYDMARGGGQIVRSGLEAVGGKGLADRLSLPTEADVAESRALDAPLMKTVGGMLGNVGGNVGASMLVPGLATYRGAATAGGALGLLQPTVEGESRALNTAIGGGAGVAGKAVGDKLAQGASSLLSSARAKGAQAAGRNAERDATLAAAHEAGYVVPPSQAGGGAATRALEGLSNKTNVAQTASARNQETTNTLARKAIGLPDDAPLNEATFNAFRQSAAEPYREVSALSPKAAKVLEDLKEARFEAKGHHAHHNRTADPKALKEAKFFEGKADDLERALEAEARAAGDPQLVQRLRDARVLIAKAHTIENAVLEGTGNVSAAKIAQALNRNVPLKDELRTIATFANKFPKAAQTPEKTGSVPMFTLTDLALGAAGGYADPTLAALALARPAARNVALSKAVQGSLANPSYGPGAGPRLLDMIANNTATRRAIPGAAAGSVGAVYVDQ